MSCCTARCASAFRVGQSACAGDRKPVEDVRCGEPPSPVPSSPRSGRQPFACTAGKKTTSLKARPHFVWACITGAAALDCRVPARKLAGWGPFVLHSIQKYFVSLALETPASGGALCHTGRARPASSCLSFVVLVAFPDFVDVSQCRTAGPTQRQCPRGQAEARNGPQRTNKRHLEVKFASPRASPAGPQKPQERGPPSRTWCQLHFLSHSGRCSAAAGLYLHLSAGGDAARVAMTPYANNLLLPIHRHPSCGSSCRQLGCSLSGN